ncbi:putative WD repeat-containing and planar cell polarity effector protein fritz like protein [Cricetulus griseus]|nr:putative WD repeat-containing and planar cell polarity effector protein fritz like protein [Cricetulus griseus]
MAHFVSLAEHKCFFMIVIISWFCKGQRFLCHQMSFCLTELHLWSLKSTLHIADRDIGVYQYYDKKDPPVSATEHGNLEEKQRLAESRDYPWTLKNRRPEKLRDSLKELEELMQNSQCVLSKWKNKYICQLLFGSGVLVSLNLSGPQLEKVVIDRSLVGKLISDTISDALLTDSFIILSFLAQNKLCFIQFTKKMDSLDVNKRLEKLSALDYKISYYDIPGPANRTLERHLAINAIQDVVACWWPLVSDGAWPWTPISSEKDRANLLLLGFTQGGLQVLSCVRTEGNPLDVHFGTKQPYHVCTVECSISVDKEPMADSCVYECVRNKLHCMSVTRIPLRSKAISCCRNPTEDKLIVGCEDSSVILYEAHRGVTLLAQAELLPSLISCHPSGAILLVGSNQGELQIFDIALSPINIQLLAEDRLPSKTLQFNKFFDVSSNLVQMQWIAPPVVSQKPERGEIYDLLFLRFNRGPVGVLLFKLAMDYQICTESVVPNSEPQNHQEAHFDAKAMRLLLQLLNELVLLAWAFHPSTTSRWPGKDPEKPRDRDLKRTVTIQGGCYALYVTAMHLSVKHTQSHKA